MGWKLKNQWDKCMPFNVLANLLVTISSKIFVLTKSWPPPPSDICLKFCFLLEPFPYYLYLVHLNYSLQLGIPVHRFWNDDTNFVICSFLSSWKSLTNSIFEDLWINPRTSFFVISWNCFSIFNDLISSNCWIGNNFLCRDCVICLLCIAWINSVLRSQSTACIKINNNKYFQTLNNALCTIVGCNNDPGPSYEFTRM